MDKSGIETDSELIRYKVNPNISNIDFDIKYVIKSIKEYVYGFASDMKHTNIMACKKDIYGLDIFKEILYTEKGKSLLVHDIRISYLIYEHCKLMMSRIKFIFNTDIVVKHDADTRL